MLNWRYPPIFFVIVILAIPKLTNHPHKVKKTTDLVIGIISARDHVKQRNILRSTWVGHAQTLLRHQVKAWFIIGQPCFVPLEDRITPYGCETTNLTFNGLTRSDQIFTCSADHGPHDDVHVSTLHYGFSFKVNHPMLVKNIGVLKASLNPGQAVSVVLEEVDLTVDISLSNYDLEHRGYLYKNITPVLLYKGFEESVSVFGGDPLFIKDPPVVLWETAGNVITYTYVLTDTNTTNVRRFNPELVSVVSLGFSLHEPEKVLEQWSSREEREDEWRTREEAISADLQQEVKLFKDVAMVDVVDVYRNLPNKLLQFYQLITARRMRFNYVLKTDDDCIIDVISVLKSLQTREQAGVTSRVWWGQFRENWMVYHHGKWAELDYPAPVYPAFACGSGNVLSRDLVEWVADNKAMLHPYQGEDVSMGIWLASLYPSYVQDKRWECGHSCSRDSLSRAQLTQEDIIEAWDIYRNCNNLCSCL